MSESIEMEFTPEAEDASKSDFVEVSGNVVSNIPVKLPFLTFLIGMMIFSDLFIDNVLRKMDGMVMGEVATTKGTMVQLTMLCMALIVFDMLINYGCI